MTPCLALNEVRLRTEPHRDELSSAQTIRGDVESLLVAAAGVSTNTTAGMKSTSTPAFELVAVVLFVRPRVHRSGPNPCGSPARGHWR